MAKRKLEVAARDGLLFEVDGDRQLCRGDGGAEFDHIRFGKDCGEEAVLDRVLREDVAK